MLVFELTPEQHKRVGKWYRKNNKTSKYIGAIGGSLTYSFTPTSIGVVKKVYDSLTDKELDITDYDLW